MKNVKLARESIMVVLLLILFKFNPAMINLNFVIFSIFVISATVADTQKTFIRKLFSVPFLSFMAVSALFISGLYTTPLTLNVVIVICTLAGVKSAKDIAIKFVSNKSGISELKQLINPEPKEDLKNKIAKAKESIKDAKKETKEDLKSTEEKLKEELEKDLIK